MNSNFSATGFMIEKYSREHGLPIRCAFPFHFVCVSVLFRSILVQRVLHHRYHSTTSKEPFFAVSLTRMYRHTKTRSDKCLADLMASTYPRARKQLVYVRVKHIRYVLNGTDIIIIGIDITRYASVDSPTYLSIAVSIHDVCVCVCLSRMSA